MLLKNPEDPQRCIFDLSFTDSARSAWKTILQHEMRRHQRPLRLLLPAYIGQTDREGSGVLDPVRQLSASMTFYEVDQSLIPVESLLQQAVGSGEFDLVLVIHYFGFVQADLLALQQQCKRHHVTFVEDCAHCCFAPSSSIGQVGDFSFFSLHKFFPTSSGGVLRRNFDSSSLRQPLEIDAENRCSREVLEQFLRADLAGIARKRRENFEFLEKSLANLAGITPLMVLNSETIPHNFPVVVAGKLREKLYFWLAERDLITTALYYRLVDEIDSADFPVSHDLAMRILNLPVHQDTEIRELEFLVKAIEKFFESESVSSCEM